MAWTTADLLSSITNRAMIPDASSGSYAPATLLNFATEELLLTLVGMIMGVREKYYETYQTTAITANNAVIPVPARAIGGVVSAVMYLYNGAVRQLQPIDPATVNTTVTSAYPTNFYFQNNSVILYPTPSSSQGTVQLRYFQRPNRLEQTINCAQISSFDPVAFTATCAAVPSSWGANTQVDFIPQTASQATPYGLGSVVSGVSGSVISFSALPSAVAVGDWIALAEYTPIPEVPFEFQVVLAQMAAVKALEAGGDQAGLAAARAMLADYVKAATLLITPRAKSAQKKVTSSWRRF